MEKLHHPRQSKIHGTKTQNGEYVGRVNDKWIASDGQNGWNRVRGEENVRGFHHQKNHKEGRKEDPALAADKKALSLVALSERQEAPGKFQDDIAGGILLLIAATH